MPLGEHLSSAKGRTAPILTSPAETGPTSPAASKDSREDTATGTTFRFFPAPMWPANGSTAGGVWAIHDSYPVRLLCASSTGTRTCPAPPPFSTYHAAVI